MGILKNLLGMASTLLAIFHNRLELFSIEIQEEARRVLSYMVLAFIAFFCVIVAFFLAVFLVIVIFWDTHRILAVGGLLAFFILCAGVIGLGIRSSLKNKPKFLAYTRRELARDLDRFKSDD